ncbi:MAG TPA: TonB-dependent receptor [Chlorobiota bacterium]|nr:TonB-dependent receptor [Chlorobiota bacterium]
MLHLLFAVLATDPVVDTTTTPPIKTITVPAISVTSTRAVNRLHPVVYDEIGNAELRRTPIVRDLPTTLADLPSTLAVSENGNGIGYTNLTIRGFDQRRIAVLVNGIPQNDPEDHNVYWINMPDIGSSLSSIQVQRGAGLVNYGAAAIGGSVNLTTSNLLDQPLARLTTGIGWQEGIAAERSTVNPFDRSVAPAVEKYSLELASGLVGNYAVSARISRINSQGYRDQSWANLTSWFFSAARFDESVTTQINVFGGPISDGLAYTGLPRAWALDANLRTRNLSDFGYDSTGRNLEYSVERRPQELENFSQPHYELLNDWSITDGLTLKSSLFYYTGEGFFDYDASWSIYYDDPYGLGENVRPTNTIVRAVVDNRHGGWIPRLVWENDLGQLTAGLEIRLHRSDHYGRIRYAEQLPDAYDPDRKFYSYEGERDIFSAFARQIWVVNDDVSVTTELQVVTHRYGVTNEWQGGRQTSYMTVNGGSVGNGGDIFNVRYTFANPRLGVHWNIDEFQSSFISVSMTSREPRRNNLYAASEAWYGVTPRFAADTSGGVVRYDFSKPLVQPERMLDIEAQYSWTDEKLRATITGYYMDFTNELVKNGQRDIFGLPIEGNAPRSYHAGIEVQASYTIRPSDDLECTLWANATISRNRIVDYTLVLDDRTVNLNGNRIAGFPEFLANVGFRSAVGPVRLDITTKFLGEFYSDNTDDRHRLSLEERASLAASLGYDENRVDQAVIVNMVGSVDVVSDLRLRLQVFNVLDRPWISGATGKEFFPAARRNWFLGVEYTL